jgi:hypothetical protein
LELNRPIDETPQLFERLIHNLSRELGPGGDFSTDMAGNPLKGSIRKNKR